VFDRNFFFGVVDFKVAFGSEVIYLVRIEFLTVIVVFKCLSTVY